MEPADFQANNLPSWGYRWQRQAQALRQRLASLPRWAGPDTALGEKYLEAAGRFTGVSQRRQPEAAHLRPPLAVGPALPEALEGDGELAREPQEPEDKGLLAGVLEHSRFFTLNPALEAMLSRLLQVKLPRVRLFTGPAADALARRHQAEALSVGDAILFRTGAYEPGTRRGLALLGHELTHAAHSPRRPHKGGEGGPALGDGEEHEALAQERHIFQVLGTPGGPLPPPTPPPGLTAPKPPVARPPAAMTSPAPDSLPKPRLRPQSLGAPPEAAAPAPAALSEEQLRLIKEEVYRDLMARIRVEFERGG